VEAAARVFRHLNEQEVRQVSEAIARLRSIPREQAAHVQEEAWRWLTNREGLLVDGERFARDLANGGKPSPAVERDALPGRPASPRRASSRSSRPTCPTSPTASGTSCSRSRT